MNRGVPRTGSAVVKPQVVLYYVKEMYSAP